MRKPQLVGRQDEPREPRATEKPTGGNGNGGGSEHRLRQLEIAIARIETKLDTELKHVATKAWVLGGVLAGMGVAAAIAASVVIAALRLL